MNAPNPARQVERASLYYTLNNGLIWKHIETLRGNPGAYEWRVPVLTNGKKKCRIKVVLRDAAGNSLGRDASDAVFSIGL
ncbi:MAG: hypothetical protein FIA94_09200 [Nitrospirae bacterium]|nr:hypothetical protein [Nitrospirota bacterium]